MGGDIEEFYYKWDLSCILTEQLYRQEENRAIFYNNREKNEVKCRENWNFSEYKNQFVLEKDNRHNMLSFPFCPCFSFLISIIYVEF